MLCIFYFCFFFVFFLLLLVPSPSPLILFYHCTCLFALLLSSSSLSPSLLSIFPLVSGLSRRLWMRSRLIQATLSSHPAEQVNAKSSTSPSAGCIPLPATCVALGPTSTHSERRGMPIRGWQATFSDGTTCANSWTRVEKSWRHLCKAMWLAFWARFATCCSLPSFSSQEKFSRLVLRIL